MGHHLIYQARGATQVCCCVSARQRQNCRGHKIIRRFLILSVARTTDKWNLQNTGAMKRAWKFSNQVFISPRTCMSDWNTSRWFPKKLLTTIRSLALTCLANWLTFPNRRSVSFQIALAPDSSETFARGLAVSTTNFRTLWRRPGFSRLEVRIPHADGTDSRCPLASYRHRLLVCVPGSLRAVLKHNKVTGLDQKITVCEHCRNVKFEAPETDVGPLQCTWDCVEHALWLNLQSWSQFRTKTEVLLLWSGHSTAQVETGSGSAECANCDQLRRVRVSRTRVRVWLRASEPNAAWTRDVAWWSFTAERNLIVLRNTSIFVRKVGLEERVRKNRICSSGNQKSLSLDFDIYCPTAVVRHSLNNADFVLSSACLGHATQLLRAFRR